MVMMLALVLAATEPKLDRPHAALLSVLRSSADASGCEQAQIAGAAAGATIRTLGRIGADPVVLAEVENPCICGAQNCPYVAMRLSAGKPRVLFSTYGITARVVPHPGTLPDVVIGAHDSAAVTVETQYAYRSGSYATAGTERVRATDGARKPDTVAVRFAAGASSARLRGSASVGWYDGYAFDAARGQRITVEGVRSHAPVTLTLLGPGEGGVTTLRPGVAFVLPKTGSYVLHVDSDTENDAAYELTLAIR